MKVKDIEDLMFNCYHGNEEKGYASNCESLSTGFGLYKHLFDEELDTTIVTNQDSHITGRAVSSKKLRLLETFHRHEERNFYAGHGQVICPENMERSSFSKNAPFLSGRSLFSCARDTLKTIKKAIAIVKPLLNDDGSPKESGKSAEDIDAYVLDQMYDFLRGGNSIDDPPDEEANLEEKEEQEEEASEAVAANVGGTDKRDKKKRPDDYLFAGWMAFKLVGPMAPEPHRLNIFFVDKVPVIPGKGKEDLGRKQCRKEEAASRDNQRDSDITNARGLSITNQIAVANLEMRKQMMMTSKNDSKTIHYHLMLKALATKLERAERRQDHVKVAMLEEEEDKIHTRMMELHEANPHDEDSHYRRIMDSLVGAVGTPTLITPSSKRQRKENDDSPPVDVINVVVLDDTTRLETASYSTTSGDLLNSCTTTSGDLLK